MSIKRDRMKKITLLVPVYNEFNNIARLYKKIEEITQKLSEYRFEYLFVDDGSKDNSVLELIRLSQENERVRYIQLSRNFGKEIALTAGIQHLKDLDAMIILDADLQHPPELIKEMIHHWEAGYSVISTKRIVTEKKTIIRKLGSHIFYKLMNKFSEIKIEKNATDFKLLDKQVVGNLQKFTEKNRLVRGLIDWMGYDTFILEFKAPDRLEGESSYGFKQLFSLAINSLTSFSLAPLKIITILGLVISTIFGSLFLVMVVDKFILGFQHFSPISFVIVTNSFLMGLVMIGLGLVSIYIGNIHDEVVNRPLYIIKDKKV